MTRLTSKMPCALFKTALKLTEVELTYLFSDLKEIYTIFTCYLIKLIVPDFCLSGQYTSRNLEHLHQGPPFYHYGDFML
jgi:hypothetical protein